MSEREERASRRVGCKRCGASKKCPEMVSARPLSEPFPKRPAVVLEAFRLGNRHACARSVGRFWSTEIFPVQV
eukprot:6502906-Pyramimonas_sp.AAC.1